MKNDNQLKNQLIEFVSKELSIAKKRITLDTDILRGFGVDGDDIDEFMEAFSNKFNVTLTNFRWYHHGDPEGFNPFWLFSRPGGRKKLISQLQ